MELGVLVSVAELTDMGELAGGTGDDDCSTVPGRTGLGPLLVNLGLQLLVLHVFGLDGVVLGTVNITKN